MNLKMMIFFFGLKKDNTGKIIFGDGSNKDHLNLMMTSKYLLKQLCNYVWYSYPEFDKQIKEWA